MYSESRAFFSAAGDVCFTSFRNFTTVTCIRAMPTRPRRNAVVSTLAAGAVFVLLTVLSSRPWTSSEPVVRRTSSLSNATCNYACFAIPRTRNRLGNHLFYLAGAQYVAWLTGRTPCVRTGSRASPLDRVFDLDIARTSNEDRCPEYRSDMEMGQLTSVGRGSN